ncbi:MAG: uroporphyrinogen decarboxylase family protein [Kiritimatiellia bacterium]|jgi:uroporphyrinogen decarboxylase|nr:uroporphyrinogen decarboxylase family protein [Kiritimatiellia bacterium]
MNNRERVLAAIKHQQVDRVPVMYRGLPETNAKLIKHFGIGKEDAFGLELMESLGVDLFSAGSAMGRYTRLAPAFTGPGSEEHGSHLDHVWGLVPQQVSTKDITYVDWINHPMAGFTSVREIEDYPSPNIDDFDFSGMVIDKDAGERAIYSVGKLNHIFILASRLRGMDRFLLDMAIDPAFAEALVNKVAEFAVEFNRRALEQAGHEVDQYTLWDDIAMQNGMMMSPEYWQKYFKKWYETLFADAKQYGLKVFYHCCGSFHPIIPALLDMGVDILDPVQTSARDMDLKTLKERYGNNVCWHGGIDVQHLLPHGTTEEIQQTVREAKNLFGNDGGIVLGPSHEITPDTPVENILAVYGC